MDQSLISPDNRVVGIYEQQSDARRAAHALHTESHDVTYVEVIDPSDKKAGDKLEMSSLQLGRGLFKTQLWYWLVSLAIGLLVATVAVNLGPKFTANNPLFTFIAASSLSLYLGVFFTGLVSLRPEHDKVNLTVFETMREGKWSVVADLKNSQAKTRIESTLKKHHAQETHI